MAENYSFFMSKTMTGFIMRGTGRTIFFRFLNPEYSMAICR